MSPLPTNPPNSVVVPGECLPCNPICKDCFASATNCTMCANNGVNAPSCRCPDGFFLREDGKCGDCNTTTEAQYWDNNTSGSSGNKYCFACTSRSKCAFCSVSPMDSTVASTGISVKSGDLKPFTLTCKSCPSGFFLDSNKNCLQCDSKCATCSGSADNCVTCGPNRQTAPKCEVSCAGQHFNGINCVPRLPILAENCPLEGTTPFLDSLTQISQCRKCSIGQSKCRATGLNNLTIALSCRAGFFLKPFSTSTTVAGTNTNVIEGECVECNPNCATCDANGCLTCKVQGATVPNCSCTKTDPTNNSVTVSFTKLDGTCVDTCNSPSVNWTPAAGTVGP